MTLLIAGCEVSHFVIPFGEVGTGDLKIPALAGMKVAQQAARKFSFTQDP